MTDIKKFVECCIHDAEYEEEEIVLRYNMNLADEEELDVIDAKVDAYRTIYSYIIQQEALCAT